MVWNQRMMLTFGVLFSASFRAHGNGVMAADVEMLRKSATFSASFAEAVVGDYGNGVLTPSTRFGHPEIKGEYEFKEGIDPKVFRVAKGKGLCGGALEAVDVLSRRGRIFFPAKDNLAYNPDGWSGTASVWINTDPNVAARCQRASHNQTSPQAGSLRLRIMRAWRTHLAEEDSTSNLARRL